MNRFLSFLVLALGTGMAPAQDIPAAGALLDSYAALVNGQVITVGDVLTALQPAHARLAALYSGRELEDKLLEEYESVRANLIEAELILLDFEMQGGSVPDHAIENHINTVIHERFQDDRTAFLKALAAERLTFSEWRQQMKDQLIVQTMRQREVSAKILITPLDLQTAYEQRRAEFNLPERVRLRTLALPAAGGAADPDKLAARLQAGEMSFDQAKAEGATLQDDPELIDLASLAEPIRNAITALAPGGVAAPVEIGGARYLVQVVEREPARARPLDEVASEIEEELRHAEFARLNKIWIDSLRAKYYVQTFAHDLFAR
mgnify:CR=1 FL=1